MAEEFDELSMPKNFRTLFTVIDGPVVLADAVTDGDDFVGAVLSVV